MKAAMARGRRGAQDQTACHVLKHPVRVRILEVLCLGDLSPIQFLNRGLMPPGFSFKNHQNAVSFVSYHFRELLKADCIMLVETHPRRGATEHVYRSKAFALHTDEEFAELSFAERQAISRSTLQTLMARADGAILLGTFDKRTDRHLSWVVMDLDEDGWKEIADLQAETLQRAIGIKAAAMARKQERVEQRKKSKTFPVTFGALAFESPPVPDED